MHQLTPSKSISKKEQVANKGVVEISSSSEDEPEPALHPQSRRQSETAARAKSPLGPIARKSTKKDREKAAEVVASRYDDENEDSALSDSDSDAPFVTSRRVDPSIFRPIPEVEIVRNASSGKPANRGRPSMANSRPTVVKSKRAPTPSDPSESESEPAVKEPTASQSAAFARRFQRFADRDRSPELVRKRRSKGKEKQKARNDDEQGAIHAKPRIVRREVDDHANTASSPGLSKQRKRRIKTIHSSDEEEEVSHGKRLRTYDEHQSQTRQDSALPGSSRESSRASSTGSNHVSNGMDLSVVPPPEHFSRDFAPFFVDVQKNVDNVLSLPHELDPWIDIFQAADVLSLDTLQYCVRKPENADEFVKWVLAVCFSLPG